MDNNTHEEFIVGEGWSAFITGVPDDCNHDDNGPGVHFIEPTRENEDIEAFGFELPDDMINWEAFGETQAEQYHNFDQFLKSCGYYLGGGATNCSKCGKYFQPDLFAI